MSRAPLVRALIALGIVAGSLYVAVTTPARLGLDLRGGTQIVLETQDSPTVQAGKESTDRAVEVLRRRVDALGVAEPTLTRSGDRRIIVELPGLQDPREAAEVIGRTAQLTFHPVLGLATPTPSPSTSGSPSPSPGPTGADDELVLPDEDGQDIRLGGRRPDRRGRRRRRRPSSTRRASAAGSSRSTSRAPASSPGRSSPAPLPAPRRTTRIRRVAIVLDDQVISSPQVDPSVPCDVGIPGGSTQITGDFTAAGGQGARGADPRRRAAGARRGDRAADRRRHAGCRRHRRERQGRSHRRRAHGLVHHRRLPTARGAGHGRTRQLRAAVLRDPGRPRRHPDSARAGRLRPRHRDGDRRQRPRLRTGPRGVRRQRVEGSANGRHHRLRQGAGARSSTPTSPRCWLPGCCSSSHPGR